jgi:hypothetical protein
MSLGTTADWLGGIHICKWYLERFSILAWWSITKIIMSLGTTADWLGGILICNSSSPFTNWAGQ